MITCPKCGVKAKARHRKKFNGKWKQLPKIVYASTRSPAFFKLKKLFLGKGEVFGLEDSEAWQS
jgi:hypothetical protein